MTDPSSPYHAGELAVQERAGVRDMAARIGRGIHRGIPPAAATFLAAQRLVFLAAADANDRPWASVLTGAPGFAEAIDEQTLRLAAAPAPGDPLHAVVEATAARSLVGLLAIDFAARRRLRLNGRLVAARDGAPCVRADAVYSNCQKYIQARRIDDESAVATPNALSADPRRIVRRGATLTDEQRALIRGADTFIIATLHPEVGADCSHRGGMPGFVRIARCTDATTGAARERECLTWPDYPGNSMFNTLGNLRAYPRAGLLFLDFARGATLQLTGRAHVDWDATHAAAVPGAERLVTLEIEESVEVEHGLPLHFSFDGYSPFNPTTTRR